jgi:hypothetical protein
LQAAKAWPTVRSLFDLVSVAFSKGLGAPGGSLLAGSKAVIAAARRHRHRHRMGGAMRQNGIFGAAAPYALDHHLARLSEDHANARVLAERVKAGAPVELDLATVQTNIVVFHLAASLAVDAPTLSASARARCAGQRDGAAHGSGGDASGCQPRAVRAGGAGADHVARKVVAARPRRQSGEKSTTRADGRTPVITRAGVMKVRHALSERVRRLPGRGPPLDNTGNAGAVWL